MRPNLQAFSVWGEEFPTLIKEMNLQRYLNKDMSGRTLVDVKFDGVDLHGASFRTANLEGVEFKSCLLVNAEFDGAQLEGVRFVDCDLGGASFGNASVDNTTFTNCAAEDVDFEFVEQISQSTFHDVRMKGGSLVGAVLESVSFRGCDMRLVGLSDIEATAGCHWGECDMSQVDMSSSSFDGCVFYTCRMAGAAVGTASFRSVSFEACQMPLLDFTAEGTEISGVLFQQCDLTAANFDPGAPLVDIVTYSDVDFDRCTLNATRLPADVLVSAKIE